MRDSHVRAFMFKRLAYGTGSSAVVAAMYIGLVHAACAENRKRTKAVFQVQAFFLNVNKTLLREKEGAFWPNALGASSYIASISVELRPRQNTCFGRQLAPDHALRAMPHRVDQPRKTENFDPFAKSHFPAVSH